MGSRFEIDLYNVSITVAGWGGWFGLGGRGGFTDLGMYRYIELCGSSKH